MKVEGFWKSEKLELEINYLTRFEFSVNKTRKFKRIRK